MNKDKTLDSEAAGPTGWITAKVCFDNAAAVKVVFESPECAQAFIDGIEPTFGPISAATSMRDLCVEKVKAMAAQDRHFGAEYNLIRALGYDLVVTELQSLTLDNQQPVKEESCCIAALLHSREKEQKQK